MKRLIAGIIAGLTLGASGTAVAANSYWARGGAGYSCEGVGAGVICKAGMYQVGVTHDFVFVQRNGTKQLFACRKYSSFSSCESG